MPQNNQWRRTDPVYALTDVYSGKLVKQAHFFINEITTRFQSSLLDGTSSHYLCSRCLRAIEKGRQCQRGYGCNRNRLKRGGAAAANGPALAAGPTVNDDVAGGRCKIKTAMKPDVEEGEVSEDVPVPSPSPSPSQMRNATTRTSTTGEAGGNTAASTVGPNHAVDDEDGEGRPGHDGQKVHICPSCNKKFGQMGNLNRHMLVHTNEKPYVCNTCGKGFSQKSHLKTHMVCHTGAKPFQCINCDKRFTQHGHLKQHLANHEKALVESRALRCYLQGCTTKSWLNRSGYQLHMEEVHSAAVEQPGRASNVGGSGGSDPLPTPQRSHRSVEEQVRDFLKKTEGVVSNGAGSAVPTTLSPLPTSTTSRSSSSSGGGGVSGLHQRQQSPSQPSTPDKRSHPRRDSRDLATEYSSFNKCKNYLKEGQSLDVTKFKRCTCCVLRHTFPDCMAWLWSSMASLPTIKSDTSA